MNNENGLQAISLDEMQAIDGGNGEQCANGILTAGGTGAAIGGGIGAFFGPPGAGIGALVGAAIGGGLWAANAPSCERPASAPTSCTQ